MYLGFETERWDRSLGSYYTTHKSYSSHRRTLSRVTILWRLYQLVRRAQRIEIEFINCQFFVEQIKSSPNNAKNAPLWKKAICCIAFYIKKRCHVFIMLKMFHENFRTVVEYISYLSGSNIPIERVFYYLFVRAQFGMSI